jgi:predicted MFS family arabinose efflux permease
MLPSDRMSPLELRASVGLASIYGLRMLGMFLILPVFAVWAQHIPGGESHTWVGWALGGAYGLTQASLQLPFGMASDRLGRKRVIYIGLLMFAAGSFVAASAHNIYVIVLGRGIQGAGAVSAAVTALLADLTREENRTKAMAMIGITIGTTFAVSLVLGPWLYHLISVPGIFALTGVLALIAIVVVKFAVPDPRASRFHSDTEATPAKLRDVLRDAQLLRLDFGIFTVHASQMAMFIVIPFALSQSSGIDVNHHWEIYLPVMAIAFAAMVPAIIYGETKARLREVFIGSILLMMAAEISLALVIHSFWGTAITLVFFFMAFNVLEASLPSIISKLAPVSAKGTAIGVYNTSQSLGLAVGGAVGGYLSQHYGPSSVFVFGASLATVWLLLSFGMKRLPAVRTMMFHLEGVSLDEARRLEARLAAILGVTEATVIAQEGVAYVKVDRHRIDEQALRQVLSSG